MTFMTFYTPTYKRPTYLAICRRSVQMQTCRSFQHMVIVDDSGIGVDGMFRDIPRHAPNMRGQYVYILADDDRLLDPDGLDQVMWFAKEHDNPPVIILKNHKWGSVFPQIWEAEPQLGMIDTGNFVIRADVFKETVDRFGERYEGDFDYIHYLWEAGYPFAWFDYEFSTMQVGGKGKTEFEIMTAGKPMLVKALRGFVSIVGGQKYNLHPGSVVEMPAGADWVTARLCEPVIEEPQVDEPVEFSVVEPVEQAVSRRGRKRK